MSTHSTSYRLRILSFALASRCAPPAVSRDAVPSVRRGCQACQHQGTKCASKTSVSQSQGSHKYLFAVRDPTKLGVALAAFRLRTAWLATQRLEPALCFIRLFESQRLSRHVHSLGGGHTDGHLSEYVSPDSASTFTVAPSRTDIGSVPREMCPAVL